MSFLNKVAFFFRKKQIDGQPGLKKKKSKNRPAKAKSKQPKTKQKSKIFVPASIHSPEMASDHQEKIIQSYKTTAKKNNNVRIPSQVKLVITGSVGAGKTTAIGAISDSDPITTETVPTDETALLKATTTTSMDYGTFNHQLKSKIHLYGTPGQKRFSFMGAILTEGASGLIILINNNQKSPLEDLNFYLTHNQEFLQSNHAVVGITHFDVNNKHSIADYKRFMKKFDMQWPVVPIDARKSDDVLRLIDIIIDVTFRETPLEA